MSSRVVAIDGPAGSGKSTVARAVAEALGLDVLDTGAMYRGVTYAVLRRGVDPLDAPAVAEVARTVSLVVERAVVVDGVDATDAIRGPEVTGAVSHVAANPEVRRELVARQRAWVAARGGGVVEGRDIGTVVFPDAVLKVFLTAEETVRVARRQRDEAAARRPSEAGVVRAGVVSRDRIDSTRPVAPLAPAPDAVVIDTTERDVHQVVAEVLERAEHALGGVP